MDSKAGHYISMLTFLNIVWQQKGSKMQPHCAYQPDYTLPHPLEDAGSPWVTDTQRLFQLASFPGPRSVSALEGLYMCAWVSIVEIYRNLHHLKISYYTVHIILIPLSVSLKMYTCTWVSIVLAQHQMLFFGGVCVCVQNGSCSILSFLMMVIILSLEYHNRMLKRTSK